MSDIEFMAIKEFDGKAVYEHSNGNNTTGVKITRTIANGKTFYLGKCSLAVDSSDANDISIGVSGNINRYCFVDIKYDGTVIDTIYYNNETGSAVASDPGGGGTGFAKFEATAIGESLEGNGSKKVEIEIASTDTTTEYNLKLVGWEEDTGTSPQV